MEIKLIKDDFSRFVPVYENTLAREETMEAVVPDTLPDVGRILDADVAVYLRSKELEAGRITVTGAVEGTVLCASEDGRATMRLALSSPCSFVFEDAELGEDCRVHAFLHSYSADARLLNPRKVLLRCEVGAEVTAYSLRELSCARDVEEAALQTLCQERSVTCLSAVQEKTFVVTEEFSLPKAADGQTELLMSRVSASVEETKQVGNKLIFQGTIRLGVLYLTEGETLPAREEFSTPYSQVMDLDGEGSGSCQLRLMQTAAYTELLPDSYGNSGVTLEAHLVAQAVCESERELRYLADAYSNRCGCLTESQELTFPKGQLITMRANLREAVELPEAGREILQCYLTAGRVSFGEEGAHIPLQAHILYTREDGAIESATVRLRGEASADASGATLRAIQLRLGEPYANLNGAALELRVSVELDAVREEQEKISVLSSVELLEETTIAPGSTPSVTVVKNREGSTWALAKKYHSTQKLIEEANPEGTEKGIFLLIPRAR